MEKKFFTKDYNIYKFNDAGIDSGFPLITARILLAVIIAIFSLTSVEALPMCGNKTAKSQI